MNRTTQTRGARALRARAPLVCVVRFIFPLRGNIVPMSQLAPSPSFSRTFTRIFVPVAFQNLFFSLIGILDVLMVGQLGDAPVAAVGLAGQFYFLLTPPCLARPAAHRSLLPNIGARATCLICAACWIMPVDLPGRRGDLCLRGSGFSSLGDGTLYSGSRRGRVGRLLFADHRLVLRLHGHHDHHCRYCPLDRQHAPAHVGGGKHAHAGHGPGVLPDLREARPARAGRARQRPWYSHQPGRGMPGAGAHGDRPALASGDGAAPVVWLQPGLCVTPPAADPPGLPHEFSLGAGGERLQRHDGPPGHVRLCRLQHFIYVPRGRAIRSVGVHHHLQYFVGHHIGQGSPRPPTGPLHACWSSAYSGPSWSGWSWPLPASR